MTSIELHGGPADGRTVHRERDLIVQLRDEQGPLVVTHWYNLDGYYMGPTRVRRRHWWVRLADWWTA